MIEEIFARIGDTVGQMTVYVLVNYQHNWLPLLLAILVAAVMRAQVNTDRLKLAMNQRAGLAIVASVAVGAFTPLCACGTTAVVIGMLGASVPWAPVMAFLTSSPLMSPDGFIMLAGMVDLRFAVAMAAASVVIGLGSGFVTRWIELRTGFLASQSRLEKGQLRKVEPACGSACDQPAKEVLPVTACCTAPAGLVMAGAGCGCGVPVVSEQVEAAGNQPIADTSAAPAGKFTIKWQAIGESLVEIGLKQILPFFTLFVAIGFLIEHFVPSNLIAGVLGKGNPSAVFLAALFGLPLYVTGESAVPLVKSLLAGGASQGAMLAFMITGAATSAWVVAGLASFMKRRALGLYLGLILAGGIICGYAYDLVLLFLS